MEIYCDGACIPNPGMMGVGLFSEQIQLSVPLGEGTNNIAELCAIYLAMLHGSKGDIIYSDSVYAIKMTQGLWRTTANKQLVFSLQELHRKKELSIEWIQGHSSNDGNIISDMLASQAASVKIPKLSTDRLIHKLSSLLFLSKFPVSAAVLSSVSKIERKVFPRNVQLNLFD